MRIGIDIDEVIADTLSVVLKNHNAEFGTAFSRNDFYSYRFWETWGGTREEAIKEIYSFWSNHIQNVPLMRGALENIYELKRAGHTLYVVTGRQDEFIEETKTWIQKHFPGIFEDIFFTNAYGLNKQSRSKAKICKELGIDVLIEDDLDHINDCIQQGVRVVLFDSPWNKSASPDVTRVHSWKEIEIMMRQQ